MLFGTNLEKQIFSAVKKFDCVNLEVGADLMSESASGILTHCNDCPVFICFPHRNLSSYTFVFPVQHTKTYIVYDLGLKNYDPRRE